MALIQLRRDTKANWTAVNPTLAPGEMGLETDTTYFKIGNGISAWAALQYFQGKDGPQGAPGPQGEKGDVGAKGDPGTPSTVPGPAGDWASPQGMNVQSGQSYELVLADAGKLVMSTHPSSLEVYIPANATVAFQIGQRVDILQGNTGQVIVYPRVGVTLRATPSAKLRTQWSAAGVMKIGTNEWVLMGDLYPI